MHEIVFISGKGGTGKTSITASIGYLLAENCVIADCDVDAANMHLLTDPQKLNSEIFLSGKIPVIDQTKCGGCGVCANICNFKAIDYKLGLYKINEINCEGCGYCSRVCPRDAITLQENNVGNWYVSNTRFKNMMVHANLKIGAENSGKLVTKVKNEARSIAKKIETEFILVDGSPGIGCPVISSLSGASIAVIVTEPTISGFHDLKRIHELIKKFNIKSACIINKYDINLELSKQIEEYMNNENIISLSKLRYDKKFSEAIIADKTIAEYDESIAAALKKDLEIITNNLN